MATSWTDARKTEQGEAIRRWRPWDQSSGPKTHEGKAIVGQNSFKGSPRVALQQARQLERLLLADAQALALASHVSVAR
jgi:hypothetical protein